MIPLRPVLAALSLAMLLAACSSSGGSTGGSADPRTIQVSMVDALQFNPDEISAAAGETVRFEITNDGQLVHEFLIGTEAAQAEFEGEMADGEMDHDTDAGVSVDAGQTETFEYTFGDAGSDLLAGCHEPGHYEGGMVATITVTD